MTDTPTAPQSAPTTPKAEQVGEHPSCSAGDYVLATKYSDGDPQDHWSIGFFDGITAPHYDPPRYDVIDNDGNQFRGNGFRRVKKISAERGAWMLSRVREIELSGRSVWHFARCRMSEQNAHDDSSAVAD